MNRILASKIVIVGTTGSGKTTFANEISRKLNLHHIELDTFFWKENWERVSDDDFIDHVSRIIEDERWVIDGNYENVRDAIWKRADIVVFLNYSFLRVFLQLFFRTIRRIIKREKLWNGNRENFRQAFFSRKSILLWMMQTYHWRKKYYFKILKQQEYQHLEIVIFDKPRIAQKWLGDIKLWYENKEF